MLRVVTTTQIPSRPPKRDMTAAHAAVRRNAEERRAQVMRVRGWVCIPPERLTPELRAQLADLNANRPVPGSPVAAILPTSPLTISTGTA